MRGSHIQFKAFTDRRFVRINVRSLPSWYLHGRWPKMNPSLACTLAKSATRRYEVRSLYW